MPFYLTFLPLFCYTAGMRLISRISPVLYFQLVISEILEKVIHNQTMDLVTKKISSFSLHRFLHFAFTRKCIRGVWFRLLIPPSPLPPHCNGGLIWKICQNFVGTRIFPKFVGDKPLWGEFKLYGEGVIFINMLSFHFFRNSKTPRKVKSLRISSRNVNTLGIVTCQYPQSY